MINVLAWFDQKIASCEERATQVDDELKFVYLDAARDNREARATVEELADAAQFVLDKEWEYGEDQPACARLSAALAVFRGEA